MTDAEADLIAECLRYADPESVPDPRGETFNFGKIKAATARVKRERTASAEANVVEAARALIQAWPEGSEITRAQREAANVLARKLGALVRAGA